MNEKIIKELEKFAEVAVESDKEIVVKTEPFHTLVSKNGDGYVIYSPAGIFEAKNGSDVIRAFMGMKTPKAPVNSALVPFVSGLKTEVKLLIGNTIVARVKEAGRDVYINAQIDENSGKGVILVTSTRCCTNDILNDALTIQFSSIQDGARKLASLIAAINHGDIVTLFSTRS